MLLRVLSCFWSEGPVDRDRRVLLDRLAEEGNIAVVHYRNCVEYFISGKCNRVRKREDDEGGGFVSKKAIMGIEDSVAQNKVIT